MNGNRFKLLKADIKAELENLKQLPKELEEGLKYFDGELVSGEDWHYQLINRMGLEIEGIRPKIISNDLQGELKEYLRFRHVFRNVYGFVLKWEKMQPLIDELPNVLNKFEEELTIFFDFLDEVSENTKN